MKVTLVRVKSNHDRLWRGTYTGWCDDLPTPGQSFTMLTREDGRLWTTKVISYNVNFPSQTITFKTKNSEYEIKLEAA